jgi:integrase
MGSLVLTQLTPEHIQKHYTNIQNKGLTPGTIRYHHAVIHKALQTAVKWRLLNRNVADSVEVPRNGHSEMQTWDEYEVNSFLETSKESKYYPLFATALYTGMRRSELLALRWSDLDFIFGQISVSRSLHQLKNGSYIFTQPKSAKSKRTIALSSFVILTLQSLYEKKAAMKAKLNQNLADDELVFSTQDGNPWRPNTITRAWHDIAVKAGIKPIRLHDARHTHASLMLKQGIHPKIVQERLGHSTIAMTLDIYSHVTPGLQQAAAESFENLLLRKNNGNITANV